METTLTLNSRSSCLTLLLLCWDYRYSAPPSALERMSKSKFYKSKRLDNIRTKGLYRKRGKEKGKRQEKLKWRNGEKAENRKKK